MVPSTHDERSMLEGFVDSQRAALIALLDQVDEHEARVRLVPSLTTVLGLVKHANYVEHVWFHSRVAGVAREELGLPSSIEETFVLDDDDSIESVRASYLAACEESRRIASEHDLEEQLPSRRRQIDLRWVFCHMIEELARHAGHGDILVEQIVAARAG